MKNYLFKHVHSLANQVKEIYRDRFLSYSFILFILLLVITEISLRLKAPIIVIHLLIIIAFISIFVTLFAVYTKDIRALERELKRIHELKNLNMSFPKDMLMSILTSEDEVKNDNEDFFSLVSKSVQKLNKQQATNTLIRIKHYKNPMSLRDTVLTIILFVLGFFKIEDYMNYLSSLILYIVFFGSVFISWYVTHRRKMYICNVLEDFLSVRLAQFDRLEIVKQRRKYGSK